MRKAFWLFWAFVCGASLTLLAIVLIAQAGNEGAPDRTAEAKLLIDALASCSAFHALTAERAEQLGKSEIATKARLLSVGEFALAAAIAERSGLPDRTSERSKAAGDAYMAEMGGHIAKIPELTHHLTACHDVMEHVNESVKTLFPKKQSTAMPYVMPDPTVSSPFDKYDNDPDAVSIEPVPRTWPESIR